MEENKSFFDEALENSGKAAGSIAGSAAGFKFGQDIGWEIAYNLLKNWTSPVGYAVQLATAVGGSLLGCYAGKAVGGVIDDLSHKHAKNKAKVVYEET